MVEIIQEKVKHKADYTVRGASHMEGYGAISGEYTGIIDKVGGSEDKRWTDERCLRRYKNNICNLFFSHLIKFTFVGCKILWP